MPRVPALFFSHALVMLFTISASPLHGSLLVEGKKKAVTAQAAAVEKNSAGTVNETDNISEEDNAADDEPEGAEKESIFQLGGYIESENFFMYNAGLKSARYRLLSGHPVRVPANETLLNKAELHALFDCRIGTDTIHARGLIHGYLYPDGNNRGYPGSRIEPNELYIQWMTSHLKLKAGRQVIRWGTVDYINPTSWFTPMDLRELIFKDEDEFFIGVNALSAKLLFNNLSLQLICVPLPTATRLPETGSPWAFHFPNKMHMMQVQYYYLKPDIAPVAENISYGGRFSATVSAVDFSFSAYHGLDRDSYLLPIINVQDNPILTTAYLVPRYQKLTAFGFDLAFSVHDLTFHGEAAYSYNKSAITKPHMRRLWVSTIRNTHHMSFTAGLNWLIDGEDFTITLEFNKNMYLADTAQFIAPYLSDLLISRIEKKFLGSKLFFQITGFINMRHFDFVLVPACGYDFQNGLLLEIEGGIFEGKQDSVFGGFDNRDIIKVKLKYSF